MRIFLIVISIYLALQAIPLIIQVRLANDGKKLEQLRKEEDFWQLQNDELRVQIASESALRVIEGKAHQLGFQESGKIVWMK